MTGMSCSMPPTDEESWNATWTAYQKYTLPKLQTYFSVFQCDTIPRDSRVLDLGCGSGEFLKLLGGKGFTNLTGLEPEAALVQRAAVSGVRQGSSADLSALGQGAFDAVFMIGVLHHLFSLEEVKTGIRDIHDVLAPGGRFFSVEPRRSALRSFATWVILDSPFHPLHPRLRLERTLMLAERREFDQWLGYEREVTAFCQTLFRTARYVEDWRYRYLVLEKT